jgi:hypothetical protein
LCPALGAGTTRSHIILVESEPQCYDIGIGTKGMWGFVVSLEKVWEIAKKSFFNQYTFIAEVEVVTFRIMQYIRVRAGHKSTNFSALNLVR